MSAALKHALHPYSSRNHCAAFDPSTWCMQDYMHAEHMYDIPAVSPADQLAPNLPAHLFASLCIFLSIIG